MSARRNDNHFRNVFLKTGDKRFISPRFTYLHLLTLMANGTQLRVTGVLQDLGGTSDSRDCHLSPFYNTLLQAPRIVLRGFIVPNQPSIVNHSVRSSPDEAVLSVWMMGTEAVLLSKNNHFRMATKSSLLTVMCFSEHHRTGPKILTNQTSMIETD